MSQWRPVGFRTHQSDSSPGPSTPPPPTRPSKPWLVVLNWQDIGPGRGCPGRHADPARSAGREDWPPGCGSSSPRRVGLPLIQQEPEGRARSPELQPCALKCPGALPSEGQRGLPPTASALSVLFRNRVCGGGLPARKTTKMDLKEEGVGPLAGSEGGGVAGG